MTFARAFFARLAPAALLGSASLSSVAQISEPYPNSTMPSVTLERAARAPIFFPPFPPSLDQPINRATISSGGTAPPEGLAQYTGEIFYPQLGSHLLAQSLSGRLAQQLADYRAARRALVNEIEQVLAATKDDEPEARRTKLQALAQRQAARLTALEKTAEQLRGDLISGDRNWSDFREWHLGDQSERRGFSPLETGQVMRAYAHYQKNLLPQQRRLLREISVELAMAAESAEKAAAATPYVFFSPETARVIFPPEAPAPVAAKIAAYLTKKSQVKKELYDAVYAYDGKSSIFSNPLRGMAEKQAAALAELDALAEEIRLGLAPFTTRPPPPPRSPLPEALAARFASVANRRAALQNDAANKIEALVARLQRDRVPARITYRFDDTGLKFAVVPMRNNSVRDPRVEAVHAEVSALAEDFGRTLAAQINEALALRQEAVELLSNKEPRAVEAAIGQSLRLAAQRETEETYRRYRIAVFEPGLSPEQRRLLFDVTIEALNLPLPRGDLQPQRRAGSW